MTAERRARAHQSVARGARSREPEKITYLLCAFSAATEPYPRRRVAAVAPPPRSSESSVSRNDSRPGRADDVARARMRWRILATISAASYSEAAQYWYSLCESSSASRKMQRNCRGMGVRGA